MFLYWNGSYTVLSLEYHLIAFPIYSAGIVLFLFNSQALRTLAFPLLLLFLLVPPPSDTLAILWILILTVVIAIQVKSNKKVKSKLVSHESEASHSYPIMQGNWIFCFQCGRIIDVSATGNKINFLKIIGVLLTVIFLLSIQIPFLTLDNKPNMVITNSPMGNQEIIKPLPDVSEYDLKFSYRDIGFEDLSRVDLALAYVYTPHNNSRKTIWVSVEVSTEIYRLHRWEMDLINVPLDQGRIPRVTQYELKDVSLLETPTVTGRFFAFQYTTTNQKQAVLYWYDSARFAFNSTSEQKNVGLSLIAYPDSWEEIPEVEVELEGLAKIIVDYWQPIKVSSPINIAITQYGIQFSGIISLSIVIVFFFYILAVNKQKKINKEIYKKISPANKQVVDVVRKTHEQKTSILSAVFDAYRKETLQNIRVDYLQRKLLQLEELGIIKSQIVGNHGEPVVVWKD